MKSNLSGMSTRQRQQALKTASDSINRFKRPYDWAKDKKELVQRETRPDVDPIRIVDERGRDVTNSAAVRNRMYRETKRLAEELRTVLPSEDEQRVMREHNIQRIMASQGPEIRRKIEMYQNGLKAQGAPRHELDIDRLRRRRGG